MRLSIPWPLPALLTWAAAWGLSVALRSQVGVSPLVAFTLSTALGVALAPIAGATRWRRLFVALGFPLSYGASGLAGDLPGWAWLVPLALLLVLYPLNAWRDAPLFPTPGGALADLPGVAPLPPGSAVLDAGCGLGAGLVELHRAYPAARLHGLEWSWPLALLCRWRCRRTARVRRGDIWAADWSAYRLVYLFQRPESMARAWKKAADEMAEGSWLVSLEFPVPDRPPTHRLDGAPDVDRPVWVYRIAGISRSGASRSRPSRPAARRDGMDKNVSAGPGEMQ